MNDDSPRPGSHDETQPVRPAGTPQAPAEAAPPVVTTQEAAQPPARRGFRERFRAARQADGQRAYSLGALIASALAGIIVGGLGYAAIDAATGDDHGPGRDGWVQRDDDRGPGDRGGMRGGPRGVPGQLPPTTAPEDDEGSAS